MTDVLETGKAFLGIGWSFPPLLEEGHVVMTGYEQDIQQAIWIILGTSPGERLMRPTFGAGLNDFLFEPISTTTLQLIKHRVERSLIDWEPRIDVEEVTVTPDPSQRTRLDIEIRYRVRASNAQFNLVYPFYLEEGALEQGSRS